LLPKGATFEILQRDWENIASFQVRIKSNEYGWLTIAEYLSKKEAEHIVKEANTRLRGL
jgi:hypothetical protein